MQDTLRKAWSLFIITVIMPFMLFGCVENPASLPNKGNASVTSPHTEQETMLSEYGVALTQEQIGSVDIDGFLHDMDCFFGAGGTPFAVPVENAECERYEGDGYAYQRWIGGEIIIEEMLIGDVQVYQKELSFPIEEDIGFPE